jgi:hypothetical protein
MNKRTTKRLITLLLVAVLLFGIWACEQKTSADVPKTYSDVNASAVSKMVSFDDSVIICESYTFGIYEMTYDEQVLHISHNGKSKTFNMPESVVPKTGTGHLSEHRKFVNYHPITEYLEIMFGEYAKYGGDGYTDVIVVELNDDGSFSDQSPAYFNVIDSIDEDFFLEGLQIKESGTGEDESGKYTVLILKDGEETMTVHVSYQNWEPIRFGGIAIAESIYDDDYWAIGTELFFPDRCYNPETDDFRFGVVAYVGYKDGKFELKTNADGTPYIEVGSYGSGC